MKARAGAIALWSATMLAVVGCGVPTDPGPRALPADKVPFGLLDPDISAPATTTPQRPASIMVYLVSGDRLAAVRREAEGPATPEGALRALLAGPTPAEAAAGLRTAIASTSGVSSPGTVGGQAQIDLDRSFATAGAAEQILGIAQIVYTVTALPDAEAVTFTLSGRPVEVPRGDGTLTSGPLSRSDFPGVAPP